jgi:hypothetical protein
LPARFRDIKRVLVSLGFTVVAPSSGSHWKIRDKAGKVYPLPCPNGERSEISDVYLKGLCRTYGLDFSDFKGRL